MPNLSAAPRTPRNSPVELRELSDVSLWFRGKRCPFFRFVFLCLVQCFFAVFYRSSLLRVAVWKKFGSELLFLSVVVDFVFFDSVLPRLLFYYLVFRFRKCLGKILLMSGPLFEKISGSKLFFWRRCWSCVFCAVLPMFLLYSLVFRSRKCIEKNLMIDYDHVLRFFRRFMYGVILVISLFLLCLVV